MATAKIEQKYLDFLAAIDLLKREQEQLIDEYRKKLEERKLFQLKENINTKK